MSSNKGSGSLSSNMTAGQLSKPEWFGNVIMTQPSYNAIQFLTNMCCGVPTLDRLKEFKDKNMDMLTNIKAYSAKVIRQREYNFPVMSNVNAIFAVIATRTALGSSLVLTFQNSTDNLFRIYNVVNCAGILGLVTDQSGNTITISPYASWNTNALITSFGGSDFAVAQTVNMVYDIADNDAVRNNTSIYVVPEDIKNYAGVTFESLTIKKDDVMQGNFIKTLDSASGSYRFQKDYSMLNRFFAKQEKKILTSIGLNDGTKATQKGFIQLTKTYGIYVPSISRVSRTTLNSISSEMNVKSGNYKLRTIAVLCGSEFMKTITEDVGLTLLAYTGVENTIGGMQVNGLDWKYYQFNGCKFVFINYPPFNDGSVDATSSILGGYKTQHNALFLDLSPVETDGGEAPALMPYSFDTKRYRYMILPGLISEAEILSGSMDGKDMVGQDFSSQVVSTLNSGLTVSITGDGGVHLTNPYAHGYFEVTL